jgi:hypothetical protein
MTHANDRHDFIKHGLRGLAAIAFTIATAHAASLNTELLANGNAEIGSTSGWVTNGFEAIDVNGAVKPGNVGLPAGANLGRFVFNAGSGPTSGQTLSQTVDVASLASAIDADAVASNFSILIQSRTEGGTFDRISGELRFVDGLGALTGLLSFSDPHIVAGTYDWALVSDLRDLPVGTRSIELFLSATRSGGVQTDVFADNASLVLTSAVPEPDAAWLLLAGLPLLAAGRRRAGRYPSRS